MTSTSSPQAFVPVAVIILVPIDVDCEAATVEGITGAGDLPVATLPGDSEAARAAGVAVAESPEVQSALERLLAAVACHRRLYPLARAMATPWFGVVPETEVR